MYLGRTFQEKYENFFKFFGESSRTLNEINNFIHENKIPIDSHINNINLNMIDPQNLNILFHVIRKSISDLDCFEKLKLLIEKYHVKYNLFDVSRHRTLPFYTCVKGYLESTKYLIEKMNYNIKIRDSREETLFFSAIRSYNIELVKYLDEKYKNYIYYPNIQYNSCIFNIFKNSMKKEGEEKIKNLLRFIISKGFDIEQKNNNEVSFKDLCRKNGIINYLDDVLKEFEVQNTEIDQKKISDTDVNNSCLNNNYNNNPINKELLNESVISKLTEEKDKIINDNMLMKNNDESKMIIDSDNSINNNNEGEKSSKKNNDKKNSISENINDDYYTFSDISSINPNNNNNTENICIFKDNNEIKNKNIFCNI